MHRYLLHFLLAFICFHARAQPIGPHIIVLGTAQDGGYPHMGCSKNCCAMAWQHDSLKRYVVSLALVDPAGKKWWLFEATPDIKEQLHYFQSLTNGQYDYLPAGIFITHAHIGHYTGLMQLGREVMSAKEIPVYELHKMKTFLENNGPWSQLVALQNIDIRPMTEDVALPLPDKIMVTAFTVPHRDEFSETAGFKISTPQKRYLFIPDINKWEKWSRKITDEVKTVDIALIDATFFDGTELPGRNISEVPHPFVSETMSLFREAAAKSRVWFIHTNHTNPLLWNAQKRNDVRNAGFNIAEQGQEL